MRQFRTLGAALILDACKQCGVVWFDAREFEQASEIGRGSAKGYDRSLAIGSASDETLTSEVLKSLATFLCLPF